MGRATTESNDQAIKKRIEEATKRSLIDRFIDHFYGFDYFVSYRWSDGRTYAVELVERLQAKNFDCFLDSSEFGAGVNWKQVGDTSLRKTSRLILVGSPEIHQSAAVLRELQVFTATGKRVIPINIGNSLIRPEVASGLLDYLSSDEIWIGEPLIALQDGPSHATIDKLQSSFDLERKEVSRKRFFRIVSVVLGLLLLIAAASLLRLWWNLPEKRVAAALTRLRSNSFIINQGKTDSGARLFELEIPKAPITWDSVATDLATLEKYGDVTELDANFSLIKELSPFSALTSIRSMSVAGCDLNDLSPLAGMSLMQNLVLAQNPNLEDDDLKVLQGMHQLQSIELDGCWRISDQGLGHLAYTSINRLWLNSCRLVDNSGLQQLLKLPLRELRVKNTSVRVTEEFVTLIAEFPELRTLAVSPTDSRPDAIEKLKKQFLPPKFTLDIKEAKSDFGQP